MELEDFTGKPCRSKMAYEFLPKKKIHINLEEAREEIEGKIEVELASKVLLMCKIMHATVSLFSSGKILVRGEREEEKAKKIAKILISELKKSAKN